MSNKSETPFKSIESAHEYVSLLGESIEETIQDIEAQIAFAVTENADRRIEALQLVTYKLVKLSEHMTASRRILKDLRTLRSLMFGEHTHSTRQSG